MIVTDIRHRCEGAQCTLRADVRSEAWIKERFDLWFRVPSELVPHHGDEPDASPFLAGLLLWCSRRDETLRIEGGVSPRLLATAPLLIDMFRAFWPGLLSPVEVQCEPREPGPGSDAVACFFTRGVDSWYTVLTHGERSYDGPPLTHAIYMPSVDFMFDDEHRARSAVATAGASREAGLTPVIVDSNLRRHTEPFLHWGHYCGAGLSAAALALGTRRVVLAASRSYGRLGPFGTHPLTDPLWSTERTEIIHHGSEATRWDKVKRLASEPLALRTLKVCFDANTDANCGRCPKCLLTMAMLEVAGALDQSPFDVPIDHARLARLDFPLEWPELFHESVLPEVRDPKLASAIHAITVRPLARETWAEARGLVRSVVELVTTRGRGLARRLRGLPR